MNTNIVSARDIHRKYKEIIERVKQTKQPAVLMSKKEPQAVIVSLEDYQRLQEMHRRNSAKNLLDWATDARELLKGEVLPSDLGEQHDYYLWEEATTT